MFSCSYTAHGLGKVDVTCSMTGLELHTTGTWMGDGSGVAASAMAT